MRHGALVPGAAEVLADLRQGEQVPEGPAVGAVGIDFQGVQLDQEVVHLLGAQALPGLDGALQATRGRLAHQRCNVEICPLRTDFSLDASELIALIGR